MESLNTDFYDLIRSLATDLISLLTMLICIVVAFVRRKRHPKISLIVALALILLALHSLFFTFADIFISRWLVTGMGVSTDRYYFIAGLSANVIAAVIFSLLLIGIFIDRKPSVTET